MTRRRRRPPFPAFFSVSLDRHPSDTISVVSGMISAACLMISVQAATKIGKYRTSGFCVRPAT